MAWPVGLCSATCKQRGAGDWGVHTDARLMGQFGCWGLISWALNRGGQRCRCNITEKGALRQRLTRRGSKITSGIFYPEPYFHVVVLGSATDATFALITRTINLPQPHRPYHGGTLLTPSEGERHIQTKWKETRELEREPSPVRRPYWIF